VCHFTAGLDAVIDFGIIPVLVDKLVMEKEEEILILILKLIKILNEGELAPTIL
jgi:riboflavin transporter FmnP